MKIQRVMHWLEQEYIKSVLPLVKIAKQENHKDLIVKINLILRFSRN